APCRRVRLSSDVVELRSRDGCRQAPYSAACLTGARRGPLRREGIQRSICSFIHGAASGSASRFQRASMSRKKSASEIGDGRWGASGAEQKISKSKREAFVKRTISRGVTSSCCLAFLSSASKLGESSPRGLELLM